MREIKFRAWDEITKIMHYPKSDMMWDVAHIIKSFEPIMQFTGLKDKNGKEIYEEDILGFWDIDETNYQKFIDDNFPDFDTWDGKKIYKKSQMKWSNDAYGWRMPMQSRLKISMDNVEVIGNIYENPELLNQ